jgi:tyrosine-protein phosphatase YwqE
MFFFFKKDFKKPHIEVDIHSHLLPGIDDGVKSFEESKELIQDFISLGYKKLIITPHVMSDVYNNSTEIILSKCNELKKYLEMYRIDIKIECSAEYNFDEEFINRIENNDLLPIEKKYILFETSYYEKPINFENIIFKIQAKGYIPILAHPERYRYFQDLEEYNKLKEKGVLFQCNINSFGGFYGKSAKKKFDYLANNNMIDFLGSDAHSKKYLESLKDVLNSKSFSKIFSKLSLKNKNFL